MMSHPALDAALKRLSSALDQLEATAHGLARAGAEKRDLVDTLAVMQDDRGRLACELDVALTRSQALAQASAEVSQRLGRAGGALRRLLDDADAALAADPRETEMTGH